jgi:DNA-binding LacI/PurR family transcriptional regulator
MLPLSVAAGAANCGWVVMKEDGNRPTRARLFDVARAAGVSKSTASRILNDSPHISVRPGTRERVLASAHRLNYRPHAAARSLSRAETGSLALVIPSLAAPVYARIVRGAFRRALEHDFVVLLVEDLAAGQTTDVFTRLVHGGRIDGMIVASARPGHPLLRALRRLAIPHVFANRAVRGSGRSVTMDDARASAAALDHLVGLGHERIGHVAGPRTLDPARRRTRAFRAHAIHVGLRSFPVADSEFAERGGAEAAHRLLAEHPDVTALYVSSLAQAVGVLHAAAEAGRCVPDDLSVVAYDDMPLADYLRPPLTTLRMPLADLGAAAVDALLEQLVGGEARNVVVGGEPTVVVRGSTAPPPSRR